jgi:hypothetical protein
MLRLFRCAIRMSALLVALLTLALLPSGIVVRADDTPYVTLQGRAVLPADTFAAGPPSGFAITGETNGRAVPFERQPVQGVSAVLPKWNGNFLVMSDNGFGGKGNSADYRLRWYEVDPDFQDGSVEVVGYTELTDPNRLVPFPIINGNGDRALSGADFDPESFRQAADGTFWYGEEFGPYLLHTDSAGRLLSPPIPTPYPEALAPFARGLRYVQSPEHPDFVGLTTPDARRAAANLPSSRGFEGMAISPDGKTLYPLLEGALVDDPVRNRLLMQEFDTTTKQYTGKYWFYPLEDAGHAIGDLTAINDHEFLIIERDNNQGEASRFKKIYKIDLRQVGADSTLEKVLLADLLEISDPREITSAEEGAYGLGQPFRFPFVTIESVYPVTRDTLLVINDNNYPFSNGRRPGVAPDDTEFILIKLPQKLNVDL